MQNMTKLTEIFRMVFDDDEIVLSPETTAGDVDGWDSLSHINLILAIETEFGISFASRELLTYKNVGDLLKGIGSKLS
jgi:acyl carrier protein